MCRVETARGVGEEVSALSHMGSQKIKTEMRQNSTGLLARDVKAASKVIG